MTLPQASVTVMDGGLAQDGKEGKEDGSKGLLLLLKNKF